MHRRKALTPNEVLIVIGMADAARMRSSSLIDLGITVPQTITGQDA